MPNRQRLAFVLTLLIILAVVAGIFDYDPLWHKLSPVLPWRFGLDLAGGSYLIYNIDLSQVNPGDQSSVVNGLRDVIEKRVNLFGVSEPRVYIENAGGQNRLIVELAGIKDVSEAIKQIGATPFLEFRTLVAEGSSTVAVPTGLTGRYLSSAQLGFSQNTNVPEVDLNFNSDGATIFQKLTKDNIGKPVCVFIDNDLIVPGDQLDSCPVVQAEIPGGKAQITGNFTVASAQALVERFNAGALPAPITLVNQQTIGADFGQGELMKAILAGALGTLLVIIFMLLYYRVFGIFASVALLMYIAFSLGVFKLFGVTLTLAGIAGFILSIGMAVDANVLVFERTKEELKKGLGRSAAVEEGFRRAWTSIRDSNISTLITSAVLYYFTSSFVRGFALTLFLGVIISMFSAITITRTMLRIFIKNK